MPRSPSSRGARAPGGHAGRRRDPLGLCCALLLLALALAPATAAASPQALIRDCLTNGRIVGHYSPRDYSQALANLPTDVAEYSDCAGVIRRGQLSAAAGAGRPRGSSGTAVANPRQDPLQNALPAERAAVSRARREGSSLVDAGAQPPPPGVVARRTSSASSALPTPLLIALGALALVALAVGGWHARNLVRARRHG